MTDIYPNGGFLGFWYDSWLVLVGFAAAVVLAILVVTAREWSGLNLVLTILVVLGVLGTLTLTLIRIGLDIRVDSYDAVGGISVAGTVLAVVAWAVFVLKRRYEDRPAIAAAAGAAEAPSVTPVPELAAEPVADDPASATATLMVGPDVTPLPDQPASAPSSTAWVHFNTGAMAGQTIPLDPSGTSLGRGADNDIVLDDATVSRRHASISFHDGNFFMEDNESASGTLVEGMQSTRTMLSSGSVLRLGETEMVFMESETAPSGEPAASGAPAAGGAAGETIVAQPSQVVMAWLAVMSGPKKGQSYQLKVGDNSLGRGAENDMVIEDNAVSRSHAMVRVRDDEMLLVDLGSRGGTKVAGQTLAGKSIRSGGVVRIGQTTLNLVEVEAVV
ncbi:FHA domain-containing protein [candidate division KSB1 bacterium]|nr:FHA domain-containing protein [candidate division KSB1 bacterium]